MRAYTRRSGNVDVRVEQDQRHTYHSRDTNQAKESGNAEKDSANRLACECCVRAHVAFHSALTRAVSSVHCTSVHHQHRQRSAELTDRDAFSKPASLSLKDTFVATFNTETIIPTTTTHMLTKRRMHDARLDTNCLRPLPALTISGLRPSTSRHRCTRTRPEMPLPIMTAPVNRGGSIPDIPYLHNALWTKRADFGVNYKAGIAHGRGHGRSTL